MNVEDRLAMLEKKLHRTRLLLVAMLLGLLLVGTVAANSPFVDLVCRSLLVKNPDGKTTLELKESGDVEIGGSLKVKGTDLVAALESLKTEVKKNQGDIQNLVKKNQGDIQNLQKQSLAYTSFYETVGTRGIAGATLNVPAPPAKEMITKAYPQPGKVVACWCEYSASPGEAGKFYTILATPNGKNVDFTLEAVPGQAACRVGVRVHVIYAP